jgi:hypothetical protein
MKSLNRNFEEWRKIVSEILADSQKYDLNIRLTGGIAIRFRCERNNELFDRLGRKYPDIDMVCLSKDVGKAKEYFKNRNYELNQAVYIYSEGKRLIFENHSSTTKIEIFVDELNFCHLIDLKGRLDIDYPTISLSDLLLSKMQIVKIAEKDLIDLTILILEHDLSDKEGKNTINITYIASLLSADWGFYFTFTRNIKNLLLYIDKSLAEKNQVEIIVGKLDVLSTAISQSNKKIGWKLRACIGDKLKWYQDVSEI